MHLIIILNKINNSKNHISPTTLGQITVCTHDFWYHNICTIILGRASLAEFLDSPLLLTERTAVVLFDPETHTALVEAVVAVAPHDHTVLPAASIQFSL